MTALATTVGGLALPAPVCAASGTAGHGAELSAYGDLGALGALVVKSLSADPWAGNPSPRVHAAGSGMLNSVGLQGPGVAAWVERDLPALRRTGARVVVSIWGRSVADYRRAAELLAGVGGVAAVEVNLSCPNLDGGRHLFAQSPDDSAIVIGEVVDALGPAVPVWAKLTAVADSVVPVAASVQGAGAAAVTCINTLLGLAIDVETRTYRLGSGRAGGGFSGAAIHPVAVRVVHDVHAALPDLPIVGVGGVVSGVDAVELLLAGASAVQVGTATFADPRACWRVLDEVAAWCRTHGTTVRELIGAVHG